MTSRVGQARSWRHRVGPAAAGAVAVTLGIAVTFGMVGQLPAARRTSVDATAPRAIAGGRFEASGVAHVPGSNYLLFVDDGRPSEIFLMELTPSGDQKGVAIPIPLAANVTDLEGITWDGHYFYVVGSQSKTSGFEGDGLVRFTFDPKTRQAGRVERIQGLKEWLAANVVEFQGTAARLGDEVLNIEGLAWDPRGSRLLLDCERPS